MATTNEFHDYIKEKLSCAGNIRTRKMMGEYCVYYKEKLIGDICDNCFYVKITPSSSGLMKNAKKAYPYESSKTLMYIVEDLDDDCFIQKLLDALYNDLPDKKGKN